MSDLGEMHLNRVCAAPKDAHVLRFEAPNPRHESEGMRRFEECFVSATSSWRLEIRQECDPVNQVCSHWAAPGLNGAHVSRLENIISIQEDIT